MNRYEIKVNQYGTFDVFERVSLTLSKVVARDLSYAKALALVKRYEKAAQVSARAEQRVRDAAAIRKAPASFFAGFGEDEA